MKRATLFHSRSSLSQEVLDHIFSHLSPRDLTRISLLNHAWQIVVFPQLYHTLCLGYADRLKQITQRVVSDDGRGPLSISAHVKELVLCKTYGRFQLGPITKNHLHLLKKLIPRLNRLRCLSWELYILPNDEGIMPLFHSQCPGLSSIHITIHQDNSFYNSAVYTSLFNFRSLTNISLNIVDNPFIFEDDDRLEPLTAMLLSSPNLVSLAFELSRAPVVQLYEPTTTFSPNRLLSSLDDGFKFPHLRKFHLRGRLDPDWHSFVKDINSKSHPLRVFFSRHPTIEDLALGWFAYYGQYSEIEPNAISSLLPSLKHLEGPTFLCGSVVKSKLANQLESLTVVDKTLHRIYEEIPTDTLIKVSEGVSKLPELRRLAIWATTPTYSLAVSRLTKAAGKLEELEFRMKVDPESVVWSVSDAKNLRKLTISSDLLHDAKNYPDGPYSDYEDFLEDDGGPDEFLASLARNSARLRVVDVFDGWWACKGWKIKRKAGKATVIAVH